MDYTFGNDSAGPAARRPTSTPQEFDPILRALDEGARESSRRLGARLAEALRRHDLDRRELVAAQRDLRRLQRIGALPKPTEYWQRSALPRAGRLVQASMAAVTEEGENLGEALDRFMIEIDQRLFPWAISPLGRDTINQVTTRAIERLLTAIPSTESIDSLGRWWQRRLHRSAVIRALPRLMTAGARSDLVIGRTEMTLLNGPPWTHGDRLLSAFELAHSEIRNQTALVTTGLYGRVAARGQRYLAPCERVTIELRAV